MTATAGNHRHSTISHLVTTLSIFFKSRANLATVFRTFTSRLEAEMRNKQMQELNRFVHYYTRFRNHENSHRMEEPLMKIAKDKMLTLATSVPDFSGGSADMETKFIEDAIGELLKARRVLCGSYVYGYYLEDNGYNKTIFELMQNEIEECTENLAQMVARPYLRTPRAKIIQVTALVKRKRQEFVIAVSKGLIPPETPPAMRKLRRRRFPGLLGMDPIEDDQLTQAIAASLRDLDPNNPWVKDHQGRHTNLAAIYDWPDYDSDEDAEINQALAVSLLGVCSGKGCSRLRARNPRTGAMHEYCSLRCSKTSRIEDSDESIQTYTSDYQMELLIALEMSRLQMIQDLERHQEEQKPLDEGCVIIGQPQDNPSLPNLLVESTIVSGSEPIESSCPVEEPSSCACQEAMEEDHTDDCSLEAGLTGTSSTSPLPPFLTPSSDISVNYFFKYSDNLNIHAQNSKDELEMVCKAEKQLLFKSSSTSSLERPQDNMGRLTASTGNLMTSASTEEWDHDELHRFLCQQSDGLGTSTNSLAFTQDSADIADSSNRLIASTGNLLNASCSSRQRLVSSVLDLPKQLKDTSSSVLISHNPWATIFSHFSGVPKSSQFGFTSGHQKLNLFP